MHEGGHHAERPGGWLATLALGLVGTHNRNARMQLLLWDVIGPAFSRLLGQRGGAGRDRRPLFGRASVPKAPAASAPPRTLAKKARKSRPAASAAPPTSAQARYDAVVAKMLGTHQIKVRRWRSAMSGIAWEAPRPGGAVQRMIEAPYPKGPMSASIFLHEVGHHAIGFDRYKPRCLEEFHAWRWSLEAMEAEGLDVTEAVRHRMAVSLWYAVRKAAKRGIKSLPPELHPFVERPAKPAKAKAGRPRAGRASTVGG